MNFEKRTREVLSSPLRADGLSTLQVNLGKLCNLECKHCHVEAGPNRKEVMTRETIDQVIEALDHESFTSIDITGGAPEMNKDLTYLIDAAHGLGKDIIVRTNLVTLYFDEYKDLATKYRDVKATVVASLPCYTEDNVEAQRGDGVFEKSIASLKYLNSLGYGIDPELELNLVYNPGGAFLPGPQAGLEADYKERLGEDHGLVFNNLFTITNLPIGRFDQELVENKEKDSYMALLEENFNPSTLANLMCTKQISVSWDGYIYDCDFNQMIDLRSQPMTHIKDFDFDRLINREVSLGDHCYGCTAGAGSSCGGALE